MRVRYAIAGVAGATWLVAFMLVFEEPGSLLQLVGPIVGMLIFGAIAWPDDFKRNPPSGHRDEPPAP
jgi:hypothetical protein